jgi:hypothetical protein
MEVKGKSTRGIRAVHILMDKKTVLAIEKITQLRPETSPPSDFLFAR